MGSSTVRRQHPQVVKIEAGGSLMSTLHDIVNQNVREGDLYEKLDRNRVRCYACGHCCPIPEGQPGVCKVRYNKDGTLYVPWAMLAECNAIPLRRNLFSLPFPGP